MAEFVTLEYGSDRLSRNVGRELTTTCCVTDQTSAILIYIEAD